MSHPSMVDLLLTRRSVAPIQMTGPGPNADELKTLLTISSRVPDHGKLAPWRFVVFEGDAREHAGNAIADIYRRKYPDATPEALTLERKRLAYAPLVIAVVSRAAPHVKIPEWEQELSAGAVCMTMTIAANAMGFVTKWLTEWFAYDHDARAALGLLPDERIAGFIHIGRTHDTLADRERPDLAELVTRY